MITDEDYEKSAIAFTIDKLFDNQEFTNLVGTDYKKAFQNMKLMLKTGLIKIGIYPEKAELETLLFIQKTPGESIYALFSIKERLIKDIIEENLNTTTSVFTVDSDFYSKIQSKRSN